MTELTLFYRGPLKSNGTAAEKHGIRLQLHPQIKRWVSQLRRFGGQPIDSSERLSQWQSSNPSEHPLVVVDRGRWRFAAISTYQEYSDPIHPPPTAQLDVTMLRPEPPGALIVNGGDIDNRLKTLFDALQIPDPNQAANLGVQPTDQYPMFCLLEDDKQITRVNVRTAQLLDETSVANEVILTIDVAIKNCQLNYH